MECLAVVEVLLLADRSAAPQCGDRRVAPRERDAAGLRTPVQLRERHDPRPETDDFARLHADVPDDIRPVRHVLAILGRTPIARLEEACLHEFGRRVPLAIRTAAEEERFHVAAIERLARLADGST